MQTMRIWKWTLEVADLQAVPMRKGAQVLSVQVQHGRPQIWALVNVAAPIEMRTFATYGTGKLLPGSRDFSRFVGTYQLRKGELVFHVFEHA
jgi:hypothetical protein